MNLHFGVYIVYTFLKDRDMGVTYLPGTGCEGGGGVLPFNTFPSTFLVSRSTLEAAVNGWWEL